MIERVQPNVLLTNCIAVIHRVKWLRTHSLGLGQPENRMASAASRQRRHAYKVRLWKTEEAPKNVYVRICICIYIYRTISAVIHINYPYRDWRESDPAYEPVVIRPVSDHHCNVVAEPVESYTCAPFTQHSRYLTKLFRCTRICGVYAMHLFNTSYSQVAQLSQRDRAVEWVSYGQKWKTVTGR